MAKTEIIISFESKRQAPYFMIVKTYCDKHGIVYHAEVLYQEEYIDSDIRIDGDVIMKHEVNMIHLFSKNVTPDI